MSRADVAVTVFACALVTLPFLVVQITPITDIPQQLAQIPLLMETLSGDAPELKVHWAAPNKLSYLPLAVSWALLEPLAAARLALALTGLVFALAVFWIARSRDRCLANAVLALPFLFNHAFGMGFLSFVVGFAAFAYWLLRLGHGQQCSWRDTLLTTMAGSLMLYFSHALWLLAGLVWLTAVSLWDRRPGRAWLAQALGALPALALASYWYPMLSRMDWESSSYYGRFPWTRLSWSQWVDTALGSVRGQLEPLLLLALLVWVLIAVWQNRQELRQRVDAELLLTGLLFLAAAVLLPDKIDRTIRFASRWMPIAAVLLVLAMPPLRLRRPLRLAIAVALLATFCLWTARSWKAFERQELSGLVPALEQVPQGASLLGLDFYRVSPRIKYPVYLQMHAYGQLLRQARLGFSFVSLASSLVVKRDLPARDPWTHGLEWRPDKLRRSDLAYFDLVLIHAPARFESALIKREPSLLPTSKPDRWRLYAVSDPERPLGAE